jgi:imidazolonepropionase-like amidohydrolase
MKTAIYNGKLITPAEVLENKVLVLENDRIIDILAEDVIDLGQYDEKIDAHGRYVCPGFIILTRSNRSFSRVLPA